MVVNLFSLIELNKKSEEISKKMNLHYEDTSYLKLRLKLIINLFDFLKNFDLNDFKAKQINELLHNTFLSFIPEFRIHFKSINDTIFNNLICLFKNYLVFYKSLERLKQENKGSDKNDNYSYDVLPILGSLEEQVYKHSVDYYKFNREFEFNLGNIYFYILYICPYNPFL